MAFFSFLWWLRPWWKSADTDYESVLARLTKDINAVQERLVRVSQRERRASVTLTLYAILVWLTYAVFVWFTTADQRPWMTKGQRFRLWLPIFAGFLLIVSVRSMVRWWFRRVSDGEERHLRSLQRARRKKIDEIKQATRYDHLRTLVERYDDTAVPSRPGARRAGSSAYGPSGHVQQTLAAPHNQRSHQQQKQSQPARQFHGMKDGLPTSGRGTSDTATTTKGKDLQGKMNANLDGQRSKAPPPKIVTTAMPGVGASSSSGGTGEPLPFEQPQKQTRFQKTWLDRLADKILGMEPSSQDVAAEQRYALICFVCFTHNGLCPKEDWEEVQYICPRCGTFNSRRPSSIPVSSPWGPMHTPSPQRRRLSGESALVSPAKSMRELSTTTPHPRSSPSSKSLLIESVSAPSMVGNNSLGLEPDGEATEDLLVSEDALQHKDESDGEDLTKRSSALESRKGQIGLERDHENEEGKDEGQAGDKARDLNEDSSESLDDDVDDVLQEEPVRRTTQARFSSSVNDESSPETVRRRLVTAKSDEIDDEIDSSQMQMD